LTDVYTYIKPSTSKKQWLLILIIGVAIGLLLFYYREPILAFFSGIPTWINNVTKNTFVQGIIDYAGKNPIAVITASFGAISATVALWKYYVEHKAKTAALEAQVQAQLRETSVSNLALEQKTRIEQLETQLSSQVKDASQEALIEAQKTVTQLANKNKSLREQIQWYEDLIKTKGIQPDQSDPRVKEAQTTKVS
jgi:hypothetical protein